MKNIKYWLFTVLFAFLVNISHEFVTFHDQNIHDRVQDNITKSSHVVTDGDICGYCSCFHLNFILNEFDSAISYVDMPKPNFSQQDIIPILNKLSLYKPPIV